MASSARIRANQPLLAALLNLLINSCIRIQAAPNGLAAVANVVVPVVSSILISSETRADVKAAIFYLLYRIALLRPKVIPWLIQQETSRPPKLAHQELIRQAWPNIFINIFQSVHLTQLSLCR